MVKTLENKYNIKFKDFQQDCIFEVLNKRDVFVCVPTGFGKSFCYCFLHDVYGLMSGLEVDVLSLSCPNIVLVITPLLSLMFDQVNRFRKLGVSCSFVGENQEDKSEIVVVKSGERNVVLLTPEAATTTSCKNVLKSKV